MDYLIIVKLYEDGTLEWQHDLAEERAYTRAQMETAENLHQAYNGIKSAARMARAAKEQSFPRLRALRANLLKRGA